MSLRDGIDDAERAVRFADECLSKLMAGSASTGCFDSSSAGLTPFSSETK
jgi:hypothetical protein